MTADAASALAAMAQDWRVVIDARPENPGSAARLFGAAVARFEGWSSGPGFGSAAIDLHALVAHARRDWDRGNPIPVLLSDDAAAPRMLAAVEPADLFDRPVDRVWIKPPESDDGRSAADLGQLLTMFDAVDGFINAHVRHELLAAIFYARAAAAKAAETTPPALRAYLPPALIPAWGLDDPGLVLADGDRLRGIPEAIWNANLFGPAQVDRLGRDTLLAASWHSAEPLASGAVLALATDAPPRSMDAQIAGHILDIVRQIGLPAVQRRTAFPQGGQP